MSNPLFDDILGAMGGQPRRNPKPEKGVPWSAKQIDGKLYVPIEDVIELLKVNDILPAVRRGLEKHVNKGEPE